MTAGPGTQPSYALQLRLADEKPPARHHGGYITYGDEGSSYYYSRTRLAVSGFLQDASGATIAVSGLAWNDHQWGDFVISGVGGWEWFWVQLDTRSELMLYVLRDGAGATSSVFGSLIAPDGTVSDIGPGSVRAQERDRKGSLAVKSTSALLGQVCHRSSADCDMRRVRLVGRTS
jgi:predicted secreted hydrolase